MALFRYVGNVTEELCYIVGFLILEEAFGDVRWGFLWLVSILQRSPLRAQSCREALLLAANSGAERYAHTPASRRIFHARTFHRV
jgi:hypothetical protein